MKVREATEVDFHNVAKVAVLAYSERPVHQWLFPETKVSIEGGYLWTFRMLQLWNTDPEVKILLTELEPEDVEDEMLVGTPIAMAVWEFHSSSKTVGAAEEQAFMETLEGTGASMEALEVFKEFEEKLEEKWLAGKDHWHLTRLCTLADWRRRGAASMLVNWGLEKAKKQGVICAVEGTEESKPLYIKSGFVLVEECKLGGIPAYIMNTEGK